MGEGMGKAVDWSVEASAKGEVGEGGGEMVHWIGELISKEKVGKGRRKVTYCLVKIAICEESKVSE
jgi:hypothetical protein